MKRAPITTVSEGRGSRVEHLDPKVPRELSRELDPVVRAAEQAAQDAGKLVKRPRRR